MEHDISRKESEMSCFLNFIRLENEQKKIKNGWKTVKNEA